MWSAIWTLIKSLFASKTVSTSETSIDVAPGSSYAQAVGEVAKVADTVISAENSPEMVQGRLNKEEQALKDKEAAAVSDGLKTGNLTEIEKGLS